MGTLTPKKPWPKPVRAAATRLGLTRHDTITPPPTVHSPANAPELQFLPQPGHILVLTGPSGSGKTTALRHLAALARRERRPIFLFNSSPTPPHPGPAAAPARIARRRPDWSTDQILAHLARFGLAEAHCLTIPANQLSTGQQHRLHLAELIADAQRHRAPVILLDEFAASLDDLTATTLARTLARAAHGCNLTIAIATHRLCVLPQLRPCTVLECTSAGIRHRASGISEESKARSAAALSPPAPSPSGGGQGRGPTPSLFPPSSHSFISSLSPSLGAAPQWRTTIEPAHSRDYHALAHLHYRPGHPATIAAIYRAVIEPTPHADPITKSQGPQLAGVLVVSHPTLNAAWREHAWPARYTQGDKRQRAKRLNAELRCIARVIIDPRFRSLGLATALVRHYLNNPLTPHTEALAAMGALSPFFERAGMTPYHLPPSPRDTRLLDLLAHARLDPTWLAEPEHAWQRLIHAIGESLAQRELRTWAQQVPTVRRQPESTWFTHACRTLMSTPIAYAHAADTQGVPRLDPKGKPCVRANKPPLIEEPSTRIGSPLKA